MNIGHPPLKKKEKRKKKKEYMLCDAIATAP
jgi:hypothetical protein